jgi:hypothetical protein
MDEVHKEKKIVSVNKCCVVFCFERYGSDYACYLYAVSVIRFYKRSRI